MKDLNKNIQTEIEKTLACFDRLEKIEPNPFFFTRLETRMDEKHKPPGRFRRAFQPAWMVALVVINVVSMVMLFSDRTESGTTRADYLEAIASDLTIDRTYVDPFQQNEQE
jgi:hypothetical protein